MAARITATGAVVGLAWATGVGIGLYLLVDVANPVAKLPVPTAATPADNPLVPREPPPIPPPFKRLYLDDAPVPLRALALFHRLDGETIESEDDALSMHDDCIELGHLRDPRLRTFVPLLIDAIEHMKTPACTRRHCVDALVHLTGVNKGDRADAWRRWWAAQSPPPPADFPGFELRLDGNPWVDTDIYWWRIEYEGFTLVLHADGRFARVE